MLLSLTLIALVIMLVLNLFPTSSLALNRAQQEQTANALAQSTLDETRSLPFSSLTAGNSVALPPVSLDGITYQATRQVYDAGEDTRHLKGIRITVDWQDRGVAHRVTQEGYLANIPR